MSGRAPQRAEQAQSVDLQLSRSDPVSTHSHEFEPCPYAPQAVIPSLLQVKLALLDFNSSLRCLLTIPSPVGIGLEGALDVGGPHWPSVTTLGEWHVQRVGWPAGVATKPLMHVKPQGVLQVEIYFNSRSRTASVMAYCSPQSDIELAGK